MNFIKKIGITLLLAVSLLLSPSFSGLSLASDRIISEEQYQQLMMTLQKQDEIWNELANLQENSQTDLATVKVKLAVSEKKLAECETNLNQVKIQLATSLQATQEVKNLLQRAEERQVKLEQDFKTFQKQMERKVKIVTRQRNAWEIASLAFAILAALR